MNSPDFAPQRRARDFRSADRPFNPLRWFLLASLVVVAAIAAVNGWLLSDFLTRRTLEHEARLTGDIVQNVLLAEGSYEYLASPGDPAIAQRFRGSIDHFAAMKDVLRNNVYSRDKVVLWSTDPELIGERFAENDELDEALNGELVVNSGRITDEQRQKPEHVGLHPGSDFFVETYVPVRDSEGKRVLGVVEIYKAPVELTAAIGEGRRQVWITALGGALLLYLTLAGIAWRAGQTIRCQRDRLLEAEALSLVGELASSVAHNIRNPLASIRSSAELALEMKGQDCSEQARDIITTVDRVEAWMRELLRFTRSEPDSRGPVQALPLLLRCFDGFRTEFEKRGLTGGVSAESPEARVDADPTLLGHALHSVIANAIDATPEGGRVEGHVAANGDGRVAILVRDTGHGISRDDMGKLFRPFFTTKARGLGLGLAQVRRTVERFGGEVRIESSPGAGTTVTLDLPRA